jgi:type II secretory pathway component GspD/PulD (secretin)
MCTAKSHHNSSLMKSLYVESLIVEVSADKAAEFGVQWAGVSGDSGNNMRVGLLTGFSSDGNNLVSQASSLLGTSKIPMCWLMMGRSLS